MTSELSDVTLLPTAGWITSLDVISGVLYLITFVVGILGNSLAWFYFWSKARDLPTLLYLLTAVNDVFLCTLHLASGISMLNKRHGMLFSNPAFCKFWDVSHFTSVKLSVMLVLVLCVSRAIAVFRPLRRTTKFSKYRIMAFLAVFCAVVISIDQSQRFLNWGESTYVAHDVYCWMTAVTAEVPNITLAGNETMEVSNDDNLIYFYVFGGCLLALPVIPVSVASVITVLNMSAAAKRVRSNMTGTMIKRQATVTTILFALAYIIFNIPLFINYVAWTFTILFNLDLFDVIYNQNIPIYMFAWNWTDVLCPSLNCMVNPLIYYWRISGFRRWIKKTLMFWKPEEPTWTGPGSAYTESYSLSARAGSRRVAQFRRQKTESSLCLAQTRNLASPRKRRTGISSLSFTNGSTSSALDHRGSLPVLRLNGETKTCPPDDIENFATTGEAESMTIIAQNTDHLN